MERFYMLEIGDKVEKSGLPGWQSPVGIPEADRPEA
jgi:hypothetical protein